MIGPIPLERLMVFAIDAMNVTLDAFRRRSPFGLGFRRHAPRGSLIRSTYRRLLPWLGNLPRLIRLLRLTFLALARGEVTMLRAITCRLVNRSLFQIELLALCLLGRVVVAHLGFAGSGFWPIWIFRAVECLLDRILYRSFADRLLRGL
jgi:hypothetical protein